MMTFWIGTPNRIRNLDRFAWSAPIVLCNRWMIILSHGPACINFFCGSVVLWFCGQRIGFFWEITDEKCREVELCILIGRGGKERLRGRRKWKEVCMTVWKEIQICLLRPSLVALDNIWTESDSTGPLAFGPFLILALGVFQNAFYGEWVQFPTNKCFCLVGRNIGVIVVLWFCTYK